MIENSFKGLLFMNVAIFFGAIMNAFAKLASDHIDAIETVFYRNVITLILITFLIIILKRRDLFKTKRWKAQSLRAIAGTAAITLMFWAYSLMPMAEVTAIMFTGGIMNLIFSAIILKEKINIYRWSAVVLGIIGGLIVILPEGSSITTKGALIALFAAFVGGAVIGITLRSLGKSENSLTTVFYFALIGTLITSPYAAIKSTPIQIDFIWFVVGCGIAGFLSLVIKTQAYRFAESSMLSPVFYVGIIWATILGWMIWQDWPTWNVFVGAGVIIISNLFILWREHKISKTNGIPLV